jgi:hypothetical protein
MYTFPCSAKLTDMLVDHSLRNRQFAPAEPIVLPKFGRSSRTVEIEHHFAVGTNDMNVGWPLSAG